ncbi:hypothetical protein F66182_10488 [Fusarium sp. NRRL 66182]|nr:hypothetical protein F66182_10488 [Fusarium sp. NRRL 66182]
MRSATFLAVFSSLVSATPYFGNRFHAFGKVSNACPVVFDGRVPSNASLTDFDTANGGGWNPFNPGYVKGNNVSWSEILELPRGEKPSRFDSAAGTVPLEVTISDESIFMQQYGFRRAGLQWSNDTNEGSPGSEGVKTLHFSILQDESRPLNLSHEYLNVWHESADYSANQIQFQAGALIGQNHSSDTWKLLDREAKLLWDVPMLKSVWQNFAITLNFDKNTVQAWYSEGRKPLRVATQPIASNLTGDGQYQIGILKKPTGTSDVANAGYQESNLDEGLIYGGVFLEDSKNGFCSTPEKAGHKDSKPTDDKLSSLQKHVQFWDRDNDGIIHPWDVFIGFKELGFGLFFSLGSLLIPIFFSYPTRLGHSWLPDPMFRIYVNDIHKAKHGSDTGVFDFDGNLNPERFEHMFDRFDTPGTGGLTSDDLFRLWKKDRCAADPAGWTFTFMEWWTTYVLLQKDGLVWKDDLRACYDGTLFWKIKDERERSNGCRDRKSFGMRNFFASS